MRTFRRFRLATFLALILALSVGFSASAVTYGNPDEDNEYPFVGAALFLVEIEEDVLIPAWRCSGTLVADDVFLTAAHCTDGADAAVLVFDPWVDPQIIPDPDPENWGGYSDPDAVGTPVSHGDYDDFAEFPQTYDIGVVTDLEWTNGPPEIEYPAVVDTLEYFENLTGQVELTVAGYGIQHSQVTGAVIIDGTPEMTFDDTLDGWRHVGTVRLVNLKSANNRGFNIQHSGNPGHGGGTCFGDSGGPVLHDGKVVAITSFGIGNPMCRGNTGFAYRVDIESSQDFLSDYLN